MMPLRNPHSAHISLATTRNRLSDGVPYCPCIRTLNISTGLARIEFAAPAMAPAAAISLRESCPNGEMMRFEVPYAAKSSELTPAIPRRGLSIPIYLFVCKKSWGVKRRVSGLWWIEGGRTRTFVECQNTLLPHRLYQDVHGPFL